MFINDISRLFSIFWIENKEKEKEKKKHFLQKVNSIHIKKKSRGSVLGNWQIFYIRFLHRSKNWKMNNRENTE